MKDYRVRYHIIEDMDVCANSKKEAIELAGRGHMFYDVDRRIKRVTVTRMIDEIPPV